MWENMKAVNKALTGLLPQHEGHHIVPGTEIKGHGGLPRGSRMSRGLKEGTGWMINGTSFKILVFSCCKQ